MAETDTAGFNSSVSFFSASEHKRALSTSRDWNADC